MLDNGSVFHVVLIAPNERFVSHFTYYWRLVLLITQDINNDFLASNRKFILLEQDGEKVEIFSLLLSSHNNLE
jgi:hypothetical protein